MSEPFAVTPHADGVATLRIVADADPWIGPAWVDGFAAALGRLAAAPELRALVLEGGTPYFCAGARRDALLDASGASPTSYAEQVPNALLALSVPTVAAMAGHAVGGGLLLGLWCDAAVFADESLYGANFMALGLTPGMGATHAVPEAFGEPLGRELLQTGRLLTGREIRDAGAPLGHAIRPRAQVLGRAVALAREMADPPREAVVLLKRELAARRWEGLRQALQAERAMHVRIFAAETTRAEIARRYPVPSTPEESEPT